MRSHNIFDDKIIYIGQKQCEKSPGKAIYGHLEQYIHTTVAN